MKIGSKVTNPGELRTRVILQSRTTTQDAGGFLTTTWTSVANIWCKWVNTHGRQAVQNYIDQVDDVATVLIRWRSDIDASSALLKDGVRYEIISPDNILERSEYLELLVKRIKAG